ncbi:MAG: sulfatase-like hydrolase/transferase [Treponema sp.]
MLVSYLLTVIYFRLVKNASIPYIVNNILKNTHNFIINFNMIAFGCLAFILLLSFLFKVEVKKVSENTKKAYVFSFIFVFLIIQFIMMIFYFDVMFANINLVQILFVLSMPITGTSHLIVITSIVTLLVIPLIFSIFHLLLLKSDIKFVYSSFKKERIFFPFKFNHKLMSSFSLAILVFLFFEVKLQIVGYILKEFKGYSSFYEENYISPKDVSFKFPERKKNLIFIYLESTEAEVAYCARENTNLIPELAEIAKNNLSFSNSDGIGGQIQVIGTDHSIASICCTHLGLPLLIDVGGQFYKNNSKSFFNGAYGLGNILHDGGYNCLFSVGSGSAYGALGNLLEGHDFAVRDIEYYKSINKVPKDYFVWWGIEDIKLVEFAKEEITHLASLEKPFAFSVFLEDTHTPGGYFDEECENKYPKQIHNVFVNMSKRVNKFVQWIKEQPFYEDTVIVILGDHLYMGGDLYDDGRPKSERHAYNAFINTGKSGEHSKNRKFCTFDYFPTILDCLDIEYESDGLGLGRSLFTGKPTLIEQLGEEKLVELITAKSHLYYYSLLRKKE